LSLFYIYISETLILYLVVKRWSLNYSNLTYSPLIQCVFYCLLHLGLLVTNLSCNHLLLKQFYKLLNRRFVYGYSIWLIVVLKCLHSLTDNIVNNLHKRVWRSSLLFNTRVRMDCVLFMCDGLIGSLQLFCCLSASSHIAIQSWSI
jgi:hypothetical protein